MKSLVRISLGVFVLVFTCFLAAEASAESGEFLNTLDDIKAPSASNKGVSSDSPLEPFELGRYQYCGSDSDCMWAVNGCCDCANGGQDVAINKDHFEKFKARFNCKLTACTRRAAVPPCGSGVVSCVNHKCRYFIGDGATN